MIKSHEQYSEEGREDEDKQDTYTTNSSNNKDFDYYWPPVAAAAVTAAGSAANLHFSSFSYYEGPQSLRTRLFGQVSEDEEEGEGEGWRCEGEKGEMLNMMPPC